MKMVTDNENAIDGGIKIIIMFIILLIFSQLFLTLLILVNESVLTIFVYINSLCYKCVVHITLQITITVLL